MFEGLIANVLNKVLGQFIENIDSKQLSVSILSGDIELLNLAIKSDILDSIPLPFKLKYGKVGRIFVDVPVTGLLTKPLKLEVSDILVMLETKDEEEFDSEIIKEAFTKSTESNLKNLEDYFKSQIEIKNNDSGMVMGIVNRIIDNIQIDVTNIYIRFEDKISYPKMPYGLGVSLEAFQVYTSNSQFERKFVSGDDKSHKTAKIKNFQIYLNSSTSVNDFEDNIEFKNFADNDDSEDTNYEDIYDTIINRDDDDEDSRLQKNQYLVKNFNIELRAIYNKNPKKNGDPLAKVSIVVGGNFIEGKPDDSVDEESTCEFVLKR